MLELCAAGWLLPLESAPSCQQFLLAPCTLATVTGGFQVANFLRGYYLDWVLMGVLVFVILEIHRCLFVKACVLGQRRWCSL